MAPEIQSLIFNRFQGTIIEKFDFYFHINNLEMLISEKYHFQVSIGKYPDSIGSSRDLSFVMTPGS